MAPVDPDRIPPTEYLVMEVLAGRYRTGEHRWTFPSCLRPSLRKLEERGMIGFKSGVTDKTCLAWMTDRGRELFLSDTYQTPAERAAAEADADRPIVGHLVLVEVDAGVWDVPGDQYGEQMVRTRSDADARRQELLDNGWDEVRVVDVLAPAAQLVTAG